jgi:hypothetical protein
MGIRFYCPNGHKLNVKDFQAGQRGICPHCGVKTEIPLQSTRRSTQEIKELKARRRTAGKSASSGTSTASATGNQRASSSNQQPIGFVPVATSANPPLPSSAPLPQSPSVPTPPQPGAKQEPASKPAAAAQQMPPTVLVRTSVADFVEGANPASGTMPAPPPPPTAQPPAVTDPLAEAANVVWYVRHPSCGQFGPATRDIMRSWLAEGRVSADSLVWREGWKDWKPAGDVFPQLRPNPTFQGLEDLIANDGPPAFPSHTRPHRSSAHKQFKGVPPWIIISLASALVILIVVLLILLLR